MKKSQLLLLENKVLSIIDRDGAINESAIMVELAGDTLESYAIIKAAIISLEEKGKILCKPIYGKTILSTIFHTQ